MTHRPSPWPTIIGFALLGLAIAYMGQVQTDRARQAASLRAENAALQHENALLVDQLRACGCGES